MKAPFVVPDSNQALQPFEPAASILYTIDEVAHIAQLPRHHVAVYYRHGLLPPSEAAEDDGALHFTAAAIRTLRRIEAVRRLCDSEINSVKLVLRLMGEVERLKHETDQARESAPSR